MHKIGYSVKKSSYAVKTHRLIFIVDLLGDTSGCSSVGRALHLGCRGREFEPRHSDHGDTYSKHTLRNILLKYHS